MNTLKELRTQMLISIENDEFNSFCLELSIKLEVQEKLKNYVPELEEKNRYLQTQADGWEAQYKALYKEKAPKLITCDFPPPPLEGWNHTEQCVLFFAKGEYRAQGYGIGYYHYSPPYEVPQWICHGRTDTPTAYVPISKLLVTPDIEAPKFKVDDEVFVRTHTDGRPEVAGVIKKVSRHFSEQWEYSVDLNGYELEDYFEPLIRPFK